ncbi:hypothetical protein PYH37_005986 (plasmid) [Sinorhizobium numidicum]|uniref:Uncharacterized protein n=1 Tax=Sinorhizobium numidicum TaxID=680248 RepID=A0ABY8D3H4_9HYPH|nr:hypothetical protein [Sinorhizobium numidicum]WEX79614.1 hypothetical protein PYH37_005986 [Sinorhizobium numidicum]WEX85430.1 hypothetical protein PYH38_006398 [Sinorhizobium numidicum]
MQMLLTVALPAHLIDQRLMEPFGSSVQSNSGFGNSSIGLAERPVSL